MVKKIALFFLLLFPIFSASAYAAQVYGYVVESVVSQDKPSTEGVTAAKMPGVLIVIEGTNYQTITNTNGYFGFPQDIPDGVYNIGAFKDGYNLETKKLTVRGDTPINMQFVLTKKLSAPSLSLGTVPGAGTIEDAVCVAFAAIQAPAAPGTPASARNGSMTSLQFRASIAAGADPASISGMPSPNMTPSNPTSLYTPVSSVQNALAVMDPNNPSNTTYVNFKTKPLWVTFDNSGSKLFVSTDSQYIVVLDANAGNRILGSIPSGGIVTDITRAPDGKVYASVSGSRPGVLVISPLTNAATAFYQVRPSKNAPSDAQPRALAVGSDYIYLAMGSNSAGEVQALNRADGRALAACPVGAFPSGVALTPNGKYLFVANRNSGDVSVLDALRLGKIVNIRVGAQPTRIISSPTGEKIYVTNFGSGYVTVINGKTGSIDATVNTGKGPLGIAINSDGTRVFVSNNQENNISIINAEYNSVIQTTTASTVNRPYGVAVKPGTRK